MFLQITARPDARLIAAALRRGLRRPLLAARVAGWAVIALALVLDGVNAPLLVLGVVLAVGIPMFLINNGTRRLIRDGALTTYEISDGGVASSSVASRHSYAWNAFTSLELAPGQFLFGRGGVRFVPVPTAGLSAAEIHEVLVTAAGHGVAVRKD